MFKGLFKFFFKGALMMGGLYAMVFYGLFDGWKIPLDDPAIGTSLEPLLHPGDTVLVSKTPGADFSKLVRCEDPTSPGQYVAGRVLGKYQDVIDIGDDLVSINGNRNLSPGPCREETVEVKTTTGKTALLNCDMEEFGIAHRILHRPNYPSPGSHAEVPKGKVYLVSDDRTFHNDSRDYGLIDPSTCQTIVFRLWSSNGPMDPNGRFSIVF